MKPEARTRAKNNKKPVPLFSFGERILVTGAIFRTDPRDPNNVEDRDKPNRVWREFIFADGARIAVFLGFRRLIDGWAEHDSGEDGMGYYFTNDKVHQGALICIEGREPEKVFLYQCKKIEPDFSWFQGTIDRELLKRFLEWSSSESKKDEDRTSDSPSLPPGSGDVHSSKPGTE